MSRAEKSSRALQGMACNMLAGTIWTDVLWLGQKCQVTNEGKSPVRWDSKQPVFFRSILQLKVFLLLMVSTVGSAHLKVMSNQVSKGVTYALSLRSWFWVLRLWVLSLIFVMCSQIYSAEVFWFVFPCLFCFCFQWCFLWYLCSSPQCEIDSQDVVFDRSLKHSSDPTLMNTALNLWEGVSALQQWVEKRIHEVCSLDKIC